MIRPMIRPMVRPLTSAVTEGVGGGFSPLSLFSGGVQGAWYDPSDLSTLFSDSAGTTAAVVDGPVGKMLDKSGNGNHATQATTASKPILRNSGSLYWLEFDGVDDRMASSAFASAISHPLSAHIGAQYAGVAGGPTAALFDGQDSTHRFQLAKNVTTDYLSIYQGSALISGTVALGSAAFVASVIGNSPSSSLRKNGAQIASGDAGSNSISLLNIGCDRLLGTPWAGRICGILLREGLPSAAQIANIERYLATKSGVTL